MDLKTELRWLVRPNPVYRLDGTRIIQEYERVLQYRTQASGTDYSAFDSNGSHLKTTVWSDWQDVPEATVDVK